MKLYIIILFSSMTLAQWAVPLKTIIEQESLLANGNAYKFKTAPIDPTDPFRGSYITLRYDQTEIELTKGIAWKENEMVYVIIGKDSAGYAKISGASKVEPAGDQDYVKAQLRYVNILSKDMAQVEFTFDRFYMEESKASDAEQEYWSANSEGDSTQVCYALVRIKNGEAALEDVMINDRSIADIVSDLNEGK